MRKAKSTDDEEEEERTFVSSAVSVPLKLLFRCDNQCIEKKSAMGSLRRWRPMKVMKHTRPTSVRSVSTNTCGQKEKSSVVERKAYRGRKCKMIGKNHICVGCGNISPKKEAE